MISFLFQFNCHQIIHDDDDDDDEYCLLIRFSREKKHIFNNN